jgi:membrane protease subunit HflC
MSRPLPLLFIIVVAVVLLMGAVFTVRQTELAIKFLAGGDIVATYTEPGLHFRIPLVHNVKKFEKRIVTKNYPTDTFLTSEGKILNVDFFVKWRIVEVATYFRATGGLQDNAENRLGDIVKNSLKSVITRLTIQQIVTAERAAVTGDLFSDAADDVKQQLGIQLVDVRVRRIDLPDEVSDSVYRRMEQSFKAQAAKLRAEGMATAQTTRAEADREKIEITSAASREAQRVRGEGDAQATEIYARTFSRNAEFYSFYRSLLAYRNSLGRDQDVIVLSPDSEFFRYLNRPQPQR